jgi:hypothetical protein
MRIGASASAQPGITFDDVWWSKMMSHAPILNRERGRRLFIPECGVNCACESDAPCADGTPLFVSRRARAYLKLNARIISVENRVAQIWSKQIFHRRNISD